MQYGKPIKKRLPAGPLKPRKPLVRKAKKLTKEEQISKDELNIFFEVMSNQSPHMCQECGMPLNAFTPFAQRCITAHILPKNDDCFPTLATNPDNIFFLGAALLGWCNCHDCWDSNIDNRIKMKVYPYAVHQYKKRLKYALTGEEQVRAEKYLNITE